MIRRKASTSNHAWEETRTARQAYSMLQRDLQPTRNNVMYGKMMRLCMSAMQQIRKGEAEGKIQAVGIRKGGRLLY